MFFRRTFVISIRSLACSTTTESRRRSKSNGISSYFVIPSAEGHGKLQMATSSGLLIPVSSLLFSHASWNVRSDGARERIHCAVQHHVARRERPVLSLHNTSMLPKF